jgi:uncharacterized membrane protein
MTTKTFIFKNYKSIKTLFVATIICTGLLAVRIKLTHDVYMLFMAWNLILALLPFAISITFLQGIKQTSSKTRLAFIPVAVLCLLFLPNAPYMITDLIHTTNHSGLLFVVDTITISTFAITGMIAALQSMEHMATIIGKLWKPLSTFRLRILQHSLWWLSALGVYLGRVLRWNSWDIIKRPMHIVNDTIALFTDPFTHKSAWLLIIGLGVLFSFVQYVYSKYNRHETQE